MEVQVEKERRYNYVIASKPTRQQTREKPA